MVKSATAHSTSPPKHCTLESYCVSLPSTHFHNHHSHPLATLQPWPELNRISRNLLGGLWKYKGNSNDLLISSHHRQPSGPSFHSPINRRYWLPIPFAIPIYAGIHPPRSNNEIVFNMETHEQVINNGHSVNDMVQHLSSNDA